MVGGAVVSAVVVVVVSISAVVVWAVVVWAAEVGELVVDICPVGCRTSQPRSWVARKFFHSPVCIDAHNFRSKKKQKTKKTKQKKHTEI